MRFHRRANLVYHAGDAVDVDYVAAVSELVSGQCRGAPIQWQITTPDKLWKVVTGGRSGILGARLEGRVSCVKLYCDERLRTRVRVAIGRAKAKRAYHNGQRLMQLGIPCARMLGYAERRPTGPAMVIMELIADGKRLDHWIAMCGVQRELVLTLARFIRTMHERGVSHKDLSPRNIMVRLTSKGLGLLLLDYEDVRFSRNLQRKPRLENLHHLHERLARRVSLRDRLRFLHEYVSRDYPAWRAELAARLASSRSKYLQAPPRGDCADV